MAEAHGFTEQELARLPDAERQAIMEADEEEQESLEAIAGDDEHPDSDEGKKAADDDKTGADDDKGDDDTGEDRKAAADDEKDAAADASETEAGTGEETDDEEEPFVHVYRAEAPENYDNQMAELDTAYQDATEKYEAGDMTLPEMLAEHRRIENDRGTLNEQRIKADISRESEEQAAQQRWDHDCQRFYRQVRRDESIDYTKSPALFNALDGHVKALAAKEENADKAGQWLLKEAHKLVREEMTSAFGQPQTEKGEQPKPKKGDAKIKEALDKRKPTTDLPSSLRDMPAADDADLGDEDEFEYIDRLIEEGRTSEAERAIAKLKPEQEALYLRGSA